MGNLTILVFSALLMLNYCKGDTRSVPKRVLEGISTTSNTNDQLEIKCQSLNHILLANVTQEKFKLTITGRSIRLKDIETKNYCNGNIILVEIFATEIIIIDKNFNSRGKNILLIFAAPIWHVIGRRVINLNGYNGKKHNKSTAPPGMNGREGLPGGPGGYFHGIAGNIINRDNLTIHFNGGRGSNGQNGGNGVRGKDGTVFNVNISKIHKYGYIQGYRVNILKFETVHINRSVIMDQVTEIVFGMNAKNGNRGGNGGLGGLGGYPGHYSMFDLNDTKCSDSDRIKFIDTQKGTNGRDGIYGFGGPGGEPGRPGKNVILKLLVQNGETVNIIDYKIENHNVYANKGYHGWAGNHAVRTIFPERHFPFQSFEISVQLFKQFLTSRVQEFGNATMYHQIRELQQALIQCTFYQRHQITDVIL